MVVHTPTKLEVLRQTAAERRAANGDGAVPPSVVAAADAAAGAPAAVGDLMGDPADTTPLANNSLTQDFAAWNGNVPPGIEVDAEVHERDQEQQINSNVTTRGFAANNGLTADRAADEDKISVAGSVSDVTPPPNADKLPQLNPFTPEWFAQLVGTAASGAALSLIHI